MNEHLYDRIAVLVSVAMQHSSQNDRHNGHVVEKVTRDIMTAFKEELPQPIDMIGKWEVAGEEGVHMVLSGNDKEDGRYLTFLGKFATDQGFNVYAEEVQRQLTVPLKKPKKSVIIGK